MHKSLYEVVLKYRAECFADVLKITNNYECYEESRSDSSIGGRRFELEQYDSNYDPFILSREGYIGLLKVEQPRFGNIFPPTVLVEIGLRVWVSPDEDPITKLKSAVNRYLYCFHDVDSTGLIIESLNYEEEYTPISQSSFEINKIEDHFQCLVFEN